MPWRLALILSLLLLMAARPGNANEGCSCGNGEETSFTGLSTTAVGSGGAAGAGGDDDSSCTDKPDSSVFDPIEECLFSQPPNGDPYPASDDVVMTPVVANLTDDNGNMIIDLSDIPDIAFITYDLQDEGCCNANGVLRVASGRCQDNGQLKLHYSVGAPEIEKETGIPDIWLDNSGGLAVGDIDADGSIDIVATIKKGGTIAFERDGKVKWLQRDYPDAKDDHYAGTAPSLADLDADGKPEVIQGRVALNGADGSLKWKGEGSVGTNGFMGPVSVVSDPDLDGKLNVLAGNTMYDAEGNVVWTYKYTNASSSDKCQGGDKWPCTGFTAAGNFDDDMEGEVVIVRMGGVFILEHDGKLKTVDGENAAIAIPVDDCEKNEGGPPTVADFDGDGEAEIGVAGSDFYIVADLECLATPRPDFCSDRGIRWKVPNKDCSSRVTGSSVFDFDGNGEAEVVYNDERTFRVLAGKTGEELLSIKNNSHTRLEMPIVADVDGDGNAEIVFIENGNGANGIQVWGSNTNSWVATRRIWNQHSYHVTNVGELGSIPTNEPVNWLESTNATVRGVMNNFRQNLPDYDVYEAADLTVTLSASGTCPVLDLTAKVCNTGGVVVGFGVPLDFYDNKTKMEISCQGLEPKTAFPINPGDCEDVVCSWQGAPEDPAEVDVRVCVDNGSYTCTGDGANAECREDNNLSDHKGPGCSEAPK